MIPQPKSLAVSTALHICPGMIRHVLYRFLDRNNSGKDEQRPTLHEQKLCLHICAIYVMMMTQYSRQYRRIMLQKIFWIFKSHGAASYFWKKFTAVGFHQEID